MPSIVNDEPNSSWHLQTQLEPVLPTRTRDPSSVDQSWSFQDMQYEVFADMWGRG